MQAPKPNADKDGKDRRGVGQDEVCGDERGEAQEEEQAAADPVLEPSRRIGACRKDEAHHGDDRRRPGERKPALQSRG